MPDLRMVSSLSSSRLNRRRFIKIAGGAMAAGVALAGCQVDGWLKPPSGFEAWPADAPEPTWRLLSRITFGPRPEERRRAAEIGLPAFIEEQLAPQTIAENKRPLLGARRLESLHLDAPDIFDVRREKVMQDLQQAALLRAVYSRRQLYEVMVDFWSDHFNIAQLKGDCAWLKTIDDRQVIRPHALGKFRDLLFASAHSPAMLIYLDNQENYAANPNENYARELLELHTLGVEGGYTQSDVQALARCLTGWTVKRHFYRGQFTFNADQHDDAPHQILGLTIPAGAEQAGVEQVLDMLATHPATARFIATKLARRFVADDPPPPLVARAAGTFLKTQGDIKAVLRVILTAPELLAPSAPPRKVRKLKRPFDFVAGALRQLNAQTDGGAPLQTYLFQMGQPLFQWPTPDGYPDYAEAWQGTLLTRWRFALALVFGEIWGTEVDLAVLPGSRGAGERGSGGAGEVSGYLERLAGLLLGRPLPASMTDQLVAAYGGSDERVLAAALLGSPAFQWK